MTITSIFENIIAELISGTIIFVAIALFGWLLIGRRDRKRHAFLVSKTTKN